MSEIMSIYYRHCSYGTDLFPGLRRDWLAPIRWLGLIIPTFYLFTVLLVQAGVLTTEILT